MHWLWPADPPKHPIADGGPESYLSIVKLALPPGAPSVTGSSPLRFKLSLMGTLAVGCTLSVFSFMIVHGWETERAAAEFTWRVDGCTQAMITRVKSYEECLFTLQSLFDASGYVDHHAFVRAADGLRSRHQAVESASWLPHVKPENLAEVTTFARKQVHPDWALQADRVEDSEQARGWLPVLYRAPQSANGADYGLDLQVGALADAVRRAVETGRPTAAGKLRLEMETGGRASYAWGLFLPVFNPEPPSEMPEQGWQNLQGLIFCRFFLSDLAAAGHRVNEPDALEFTITEHRSGVKKEVLFLYNAGRVDFDGSASGIEPRDGLHRITAFVAGGSRWTIEAAPSERWLASRRTMYPHASLGFGLCLTSLLVSRQWQVQRRARQVDLLVAERTRELGEAQERLRRDVLQRQQAEERYRAFVTRTTEAIWRLDLDEPLDLDCEPDEQIKHLIEHAFVAECNDAYARAHGRGSAAELTGLRLRDFLPWNDPMNRAELRLCVESRFSLADAETSERDALGKIRTYVNNLVGIIEEGKLVRVWGTQREVTEHRELERLRERDAQRLRLATRAASVGIWEWERKSDRITWSEQIDAILGLEPGTFCGGSNAFLEKVHPEERQRIRDIITNALISGVEFDCEYRILREGGGVRWVVTRGDVRRNQEGRVTGLVGAALEVTTRKEAEVERQRIEQKLLETQKLESLGILAGGIAHDFNNLLTTMLGNACLARMESPSSSPVHASLSEIEQAAQRAADLCNQMLAYAGKGRFIVQSLDLSELIEDALPLLRASVQKNAALRFHLDPNLPAVHGDATQIRQILMNLVINAGDAIGEKVGTITLTTGRLHADATYFAATHLAPHLAEGEYVYLEVSDTGCGMDAATVSRIFDPFFTTKFTGRGLGLAAVLGIVRGHRGSIEVHSEPRRGTTFRLLLPATKGEAEKVSAENPKGLPWKGSGMALVIDDEESVRSITARMLRKLGFEVLAVADGPAAMDAVASPEHAFRFALLDLTLPGMDGTQIFRELLRSRPDLKVMLMSGFNEQDAINRFAGKGLAGFIQKPFKLEVLRARLQGILESAPEATA
jgi:PAS domain S-box-containing protein